MLGKLATALAPPEPQLQHSALRIGVGGWETAPLPAPDGSGALVLTLDLHTHETVVEHSDGRVQRVPLTPHRSVGEVTRGVLAAVAALVGPVVIDPTPREAPWDTPLDRDEEHATYDVEQVRAYHDAATSAALVAWHHSFFDWDQLLAQGVLGPVRRGEAVHYRPPGWEAQGRPGSVDIPAELDLLVVEGVGAGRRELADLVDAVVWVQSDLLEAERRAIERDVTTGAKPDRRAAVAFWDEWMAQEVPFLDTQRPWERAVVIVAGTRAEARDPTHVLLALPGQQLHS